MPLPDIDTYELEDPPPGSVRIAFWRHFTDDASLKLLHEERAELVHSWVAGAQLDVTDWGNVDAERPSEHVNVDFNVLAEGAQALAPLIAALASFITNYVKRRVDKNKVSVQALTMRDSQGRQVVIQGGLSIEETHQTLADFFSLGTQVTQ